MRIRSVRRKRRQPVDQLPDVVFQNPDPIVEFSRDNELSLLMMRAPTNCRCEAWAGTRAHRLSAVMVHGACAFAHPTVSLPYFAGSSTET